ncbi:hypothetical protein AAF712_012178 [Marasmius tenuissimus]|uniref:Transmembrane protein n=1 Tax=Marasmius tenuissimus TaxID=585030 RepID=A0ABR2ZH67_9AGAR
MVDDTDPRIVYDTANPWTFVRSDFNNVQTFGEPYNQTLTGTNVDKASFTFIFEVEYSPLDDADLTQRVLKVDWRDFDHCSYSNSTGEWATLPGDFDEIVGTRIQDASMSFKFNGSSKVSVYGSNAFGVDGMLFKDATGTWQIDSDPRKEFPIPGSKITPQNRTGVVARANQLLFTSQLVEGENEHKMTISYSGPQGTRDLSSAQFLLIDHFFMENNPKLVEPEKRTVPVGATVGGILAGVLGLIAVGGLLWLIRRWRRRRGGPRELDSEWWDDAALNVASEGWTVEPFQDSRFPTVTGTAQSTLGVTSTANFANMKRGRRKVANGHPRQEQDSGVRYAFLQTDHIPEPATIPPPYSPE